MILRPWQAGAGIWPVSIKGLITKLMILEPWPAGAEFDQVLIKV